MTRRSIHIPGLSHENPIPVASLNGPLLVTSVISPFNPGTREVPEALEDKIANLFTHMGAILAEAGGTWDDVAKVNFFVKDIAYRTSLNAPWVEKFPDPESRPARHTQVAAAGGAIGCDFIAYINR
jgi:2-iminobutanoate/2-iminopropanoate deaminase